MPDRCFVDDWCSEAHVEHWLKGGMERQMVQTSEGGRLGLLGSTHAFKGLQCSKSCCSTHEIH